MNETATDLEGLLPEVVKLAVVAGEKINAIRKTSYTVAVKSDRSPVTEADLAAHEAIRDGLAELSGLPVLSEEDADIPHETRNAWPEYWAVDPLDGTSDFINGSDDFAVNIGLVRDHAPVLGVVHVPVSGESYFARRGGGAYKTSDGNARERIQASETADDRPVVVISAMYSGKNTTRFLEHLGPHKLIKRGSIIKSCMVAEGAADIYIRFGPTGEWDTVAGQCILEESGGRLSDMQGRPLEYNTGESLINPPFVAAAPSAPDWQTILKKMEYLK